jgi:membrane-associated phospholipid phosphatase
VLALVFGPALLAAWPLVALIAWSRVEVGDHTPAQVLAGIALGIVVNATIFPLLRWPGPAAARSTVITDPRLSRDRRILRNGGHGR